MTTAKPEWQCATHLATIAWPYNISISTKAKNRMKILEDLWASISGNARTKIEDPFIGTFLISWSICNWNHIANLIFGSRPTTERIDNFFNYLSNSKILETSAILVTPATLTLFYLFIFPWLIFLLKKLQEKSKPDLHKQAIEIELARVKEQKALNKEKLISNPEKTFLGQVIQLEIDRKKILLEALENRTIRLKQKAAEASAKAVEAQSKAKLAKINEEAKNKNAELESKRHEANIAKLKSSLASHNLPSSYAFLAALDLRTRQDNITLSLTGLSSIVAYIFGYKHFEELINDEKFNNTTLSNVKYLLISSEGLATKLDEIISTETENPDTSVESLYQHIFETLEEASITPITEDELEDMCISFCEQHQYDLLEHEGMSSAIAESDTIFEHIEIQHIISLIIKDGINWKVLANASGHHRKDHTIRGQTIKIIIDVTSSALIRENALSHLELSSIRAELEYFHEEDDTDNFTLSENTLSGSTKLSSPLV